MKIAFTGASGTGKTTLAKAVAWDLGLPFNPHGCRSTLKEMGFETIPDMEAAGARVRFQELVSLRKWEWELSFDNFVTDRSGFDDLAYSMLECPYGISQQAIDRSLLMMDHYDHIFFCPIGSYQNLDGDPNRRVSAEYHQAYEYLIRVGLKDYQKKVTVLGRSLDSRMKAIWRVVK